MEATKVVATHLCIKINHSNPGEEQNGLFFYYLCSNNNIVITKAIFMTVIPIIP